MKHHRITNRDIAAAAGVSPTAVSFAMNGKEGISDSTRRLILETAKKLGYAEVPGRRAMDIALLFRTGLNEFDQLFYSEMNTALIAACRSLPYNLIMASVYHEGDEIRFSDVLRSGRTDGLLVFGDPDPEMLSAINALGIPFVILDSSRRTATCSAVYVDYKEAAYLAACYLIDHGHRDIAYIGNNSVSVRDFTLLTFRGFQKATESRNISLSTNRIQLDINDEETLRLAIDRALSGPSRPTALLMCADYYAVHAIRYLHSKGIRVPDDISVISIDDIIISRFLTPALTTVRIDQDKIVRQGIELLIKQISGASQESVVIDQFEIMERESVKET